jgi:hypothetical protein
MEPFHKRACYFNHQKLDNNFGAGRANSFHSSTLRNIKYANTKVRLVKNLVSNNSTSAQARTNSQKKAPTVINKLVHIGPNDKLRIKRLKTKHLAETSDDNYDLTISSSSSFSSSTTSSSSSSSTSSYMDTTTEDELLIDSDEDNSQQDYLLGRIELHADLKQLNDSHHLDDLDLIEYETNSSRDLLLHAKSAHLVTLDQLNNYQYFDKELNDSIFELDENLTAKPNPASGELNGPTSMAQSSAPIHANG